MKIIVLTGEAKVGKTNALELLKKVNDGRIEYFQDDVTNSDIFDLLEKAENLGVITTNDSRVVYSVSYSDVFVVSRDEDRFFISPFLDKSQKLDWTKALNWLKSNASKPKIVDGFFNFIVK